MLTNYVLADFAILERMAEDTSREVMPAMIQVYCDELVQRGELLKAAITVSDIAEIGEQAHAIKSSSGTFGAERLRESARVLEVAANEIEYNPAKNTELADEVLLILADTIVEYRQCMSKF